MHPVKAVPTRYNPFVNGEKPKKTHSSIKPVKTQKTHWVGLFKKPGFFLNPADNRPIPIIAADTDYQLIITASIQCVPCIFFSSRNYGAVCRIPWSVETVSLVLIIIIIVTITTPDCHQYSPCNNFEKCWTFIRSCRRVC